MTAAIDPIWRSKTPLRKPPDSPTIATPCTTMPVCADVAEVPANYGTNIARALYFGFMSLDERGRFGPGQPVTRKDAAEILDRVADFAGL